MPAIAEPPAAPQKPAAPIPPAPKPSTPEPKPKADAPKPPSGDPLPDLPREENEFFQAFERDRQSKKPAGTKAEPDKPDATKAPEPEKKPEVKPPEAKTEVPGKESGGQLRERLEKALKDVEESNKRYAELESKTKDAKPAEEVTTLTKQLADLQKQLEEARSEIGMLNEGETPDFKKKHQEPFNNAYKEAVTFLADLRVDDGKGGVRPGSSNDLALLYNLPFSEARAKAQEIFGEDAQYVMGHYIELHKLNRQMTQAKEQLKSDWKSNVEKRQAEQVQQREAWNAGYAKAKEGLTKKHPEWFGDDGSDPDVTKALSEGKRLWEQQPKSFTEAVAKSAAIELAMTAHPRLVYQLGKAKAEIETLTSKLKEFEGSEPGTAKRKTEQLDTTRRPKTQAERDQELRDMLNNAR